MERVVPCVIDYAPRRQFVPFHARWQRFACIVTIASNFRLEARA
jgi:hypothetical protein